MGVSHLCLVAISAFSFASCRPNDLAQTTRQNNALPSPAPEMGVSWSQSDLDQWLEGNQALKRAWKNFEMSQKYRLALPSDRKLTPAAAARVKSNNPNQIIPFKTWWGARGYDGLSDFLIAIVVDPSRTDANRYGLVVIAGPKSEGLYYKPYWVLREEDMESYLISGASGNVGIECFRRDGTQETKSLVWHNASRRFRLI
jgi:hypothetical protein